MTITVTPITLPQLTTAEVAGTGVFDVLMRSVNAQIDLEFKAGRIKGAEYATVYLGSLQSVLSASIQFLLQKDKATLEAELVKAQVALATEQGLLIGVQIQETEAKTAQLAQQTLLGVQQTANALLEGQVLTAQKCKLQAEYDATLAGKLKIDKEAELLGWKTVTEKAQTLSVGVDDNSVVGKQKALYGAQTAGFTRDAEQKAAKIMVDTWNTRRMTDDATVADGTNKLNDATVGAAVTKLLAGIGA